MLWVLFEGTKLPGGTVICDKGTCFNKRRTNKHFLSTEIYYDFLCSGTL